MTQTAPAFVPPSEVAVCYHRDVAGAADLAARLAEQAQAAGRSAWVHVLPLPGDGDGSAEFRRRLATADVLVCVGGDGTVLHLRHTGLPDVPEVTSSHGAGWDHYFERLAILAAGGDLPYDPWRDGAMG